MHHRRAMGRALLAAGSMSLACLVGGCSTSPARTQAAAAPMPAGTLYTLGSGDSLGRALYMSDVVLAARLKSELRGTEYANVPTEASDEGR